MRTVIFLAALFISNVLSAQTIYHPLDEKTLKEGEYYVRGVWYTDEYGGAFCFVDGKEEAQKFLVDLAKDLEVDLKSYHTVIGSSKYYRSAVCESLQVKWAKTLYNEKTLLVRVYF